MELLVFRSPFFPVFIFLRPTIVVGRKRWASLFSIIITITGLESIVRPAYPLIILSPRNYRTLCPFFCLTLIASYKFSCPFCCCTIVNRKVYSVSAIPDGREERWMDIFGKCWTVGVVLQRYTIPMILSQLLSIVLFRCVNTLFRVVDSSSNRPLCSYRYLKVWGLFDVRGQLVAWHVSMMGG